MFIYLETISHGDVILNKNLISSVVQNDVKDYEITMSNGDKYTIHETDLEILTKQLDK